MLSLKTDFLKAAEGDCDLDELKKISTKERKVNKRKSTLFQESALHAAGETAAHYAASKGKIDVLKWLMQNGTSADIVDFTGATPSHYAARSPLGANALMFLSNSGADVSILRSNGNSPLHDAAEHGRLEACEFLMQRGLDYQTLNEVGESSLHLACAGGFEEIARLFLDSVKVDQDYGITLSDARGRTPVHHAARSGSMPLFTFLMEKGAVEVLSSRDQKGMTPYDLAMEQGHTMLQHYIKEKGGAPLRQDSITSVPDVKPTKVGLLSCLCK